MKKDQQNDQRYQSNPEFWLPPYFFFRHFAPATLLLIPIRRDGTRKNGIVKTTLKHVDFGGVIRKTYV